MFGTFLKANRIGLGLKMRELSALTGIDQAIISKIESGNRTATELQLASLASACGWDYVDAHKIWLATQVSALVSPYAYSKEVLALAESRIEYLKSALATEDIVLSPKLLKALDGIDVKRKSWKKNKPLNKTQLEKLNAHFRVGYTYESNRIEGNTLTLQETHLVINEGLTVSGKPMRDHLEAINHGDAATYILDLVSDKVSFSRRALLELHQLILRGIDQKYAGRYRDVPVRITGSSHEPPQPYLLDKMMEDYFVFYNTHRSILHPVILAAEMHERLVSIHPFIDGNGRTARLVMNLILLGHGYTIANLKGDGRSRLRYYRALESVQKDADPLPFYELIIKATSKSLEQHLALC